MWIFFGMGSLFGFIIFQLYRRLFYVWKGTISDIDSLQYEYIIKRVKRKYTNGRPVGLLLGTECNFGNDFHLKNETQVDQMFKYLKLINEYQINNKEFDDKIYIISDNVQLKLFLSSNKEVIEEILNLFKKYEQSEVVRIKELRLFRNKLWINFATLGNFKDEIVTDIANEVIHPLYKIKEILHKSDLPKNSIKNDPFILKSVILLSISSGLLFTGFFYFFRRVSQPFPFNIDSFFIDSISLGLCLIFLLMWLTIFLLKKSSRTHLVLLEFLFIGSIGAVSTSYMFFSDINMSFDYSQPIIYKAKLVDKKISRGRKSTTYYIYLPEWYDNKNKIKEVIVSSNTYYKLKKNEIVKIVQRKGFFNKRWVETIEKDSWQ